MVNNLDWGLDLTVKNNYQTKDTPNLIQAAVSICCNKNKKLIIKISVALGKINCPLEKIAPYSEYLSNMTARKIIESSSVGYISVNQGT